MKTIQKLLDEHLPSVLPENPEEAINGTELIEKVKKIPELSDVKPNTLKMYFSTMASNERSVIAKRTNKHGYYLRQTEIDVASETISDEDNEENGIGGRDLQVEEKFRAIYQRFNELTSNVFAMKIEHTKGKKAEKGLNVWKYPDVVLLTWEVGDVSDDIYRLDKTLLEVRKSLGEQPFKLSSVELKPNVNFSDFRKFFFQCVSNSKWAHDAILAIGMKINDDKLQNELIRLGRSYDVTIVSYNLSETFFEELPSAKEILCMPQEQFDEIAAQVELSIITTGKNRDSLDWEHIKDLRVQNSDFDYLFRWISKCLNASKAYNYDDFKKLLQLEESYD